MRCAFFKLKLEHEEKEWFSEKIKVVKTAECWGYGQAEQSVVDLCLKCKKSKRKRKVLKKKLQQLGIKWQIWLERKGLANLFAKQHMVKLRLRSLMATEMGDQRRDANKVAEWQKKVDQAVEKLYNNRWF